MSGVAASGPAEDYTIRGDPDEVEQLGRHLARAADRIEECARLLADVPNTLEWNSDAGLAYSGSARSVAGDLDKAHGRYRVAGEALVTYGGDLRDAQRLASTAGSEASRAEADLRFAEHLAETAADDEVARLEAVARAEAARADLDAARGLLNEAIILWEDAADRAARAIDEATAASELADSWTDPLKHWVQENADWIRTVKNVAGWVSAVAALAGLAVAVVFPGVGTVIGGVLLTVSAVATGVSLACNTALYLAGEESIQGVVVDLVCLATVGVARVAVASVQAGTRIAQATVAASLVHRSNPRTAATVVRLGDRVFRVPGFVPKSGRALLDKLPLARQFATGPVTRVIEAGQAAASTSRARLVGEALDPRGMVRETREALASLASPRSLTTSGGMRDRWNGMFGGAADELTAFQRMLGDPDLRRLVPDELVRSVQTQGWVYRVSTLSGAALGLGSATGTLPEPRLLSAKRSST